MFCKHKSGEPFKEFSQWFQHSFTSRMDCPYEMDWIPTYNIEFVNCEQYMMYCKAALFGDADIAVKIMKTSDPKIIKSLGRKVKNYDDKLWNENKYKIVVNGNYFKFSQSTHLKSLLLNTGTKILVEAAPYDRIWGIGYSKTEALSNKDNWGENLLGKALMEVRSKLE